MTLPQNFHLDGKRRPSIAYDGPRRPTIGGMHHAVPWESRWCGVCSHFVFSRKWFMHRIGITHVLKYLKMLIVL